jgi:hypothetical protein
VRLAGRGRRDLDAGEEAIADPGLAARLRRQGRAVQLKAVIIAGALTGLALLIPD